MAVLRLTRLGSLCILASVRTCLILIAVFGVRGDFFYLKNQAMYSVLVHGYAMLAHGYGVHVPEWLAPVATILIVGYFF